MTAIQPGSAAGMIEAPGMDTSLPGWLPVLMIATTILIILLLMVNILQLIATVNMIVLLRKRHKKTDRKTPKHVEHAKDSDRALDRPPIEEDCGKDPDVEVGTGQIEEGADHSFPAYLEGGRDASGEETEGKSNQSFPEQEGSRHVSRNPDYNAEENENPYTRGAVSMKERYMAGSNSPVAGTGTPEESMFPVEISSALDYNPMLPVRFCRAAGEDYVFMYSTDQTVRPTADCFMGFNSVNYYSAHRFSNAYDFVNRQGRPVDLSSVRTMKLVKVERYATVVPDRDEFRLVRRGKIKVEETT